MTGYRYRNTVSVCFAVHFTCGLAQFHSQTRFVAEPDDDTFEDGSASSTGPDTFGSEKEITRHFQRHSITDELEEDKRHKDNHISLLESGEVSIFGGLKRGVTKLVDVFKSVTSSGGGASGDVSGLLQQSGGSNPAGVEQAHGAGGGHLQRTKSQTSETDLHTDDESLASSNSDQYGVRPQVWEYQERPECTLKDKFTCMGGRSTNWQRLFIRDDEGREIELNPEQDELVKRESSDSGTKWCYSTNIDNLKSKSQRQNNDQWVCETRNDGTPRTTPKGTDRYRRRTLDILTHPVSKKKNVGESEWQLEQRASANAAWERIDIPEGSFTDEQKVSLYYADGKWSYSSTLKKLYSTDWNSKDKRVSEWRDSGGSTRHKQNSNDRFRVRVSAARKDDWKRLLKVDEQKRNHDKNYFQTMHSQKLDESVFKDIITDVNRAVPQELKSRMSKATNRVKFTDSGQSLQNILKAYAARNTEVGYTQGMNILAAVLLAVLQEQELAFWGLVTLLEDKRFGFKNYFIKKQHSSGQRVDVKVLENLLEQHDLQFLRMLQHFEDDFDITVDVVSRGWLVTLFTTHLPWDSALRVWDTILTEGRPTLFRIAVALCQVAGKPLVDNADDDEVLGQIQSRSWHKNFRKVESLLKTASVISWSDEQYSKAKEAAIKSLEAAPETGSLSDSSFPRLLSDKTDISGSEILLSRSDRSQKSKTK